MSPRAGTTLLELLIAIVIAVLVVSVVLSVYHTAMFTAERQEARLADTDAVDAVEQLARDLACMVVAPDDDCGFSLRGNETGTDPSASPAFCTALPPDDRDLRWWTLEHVEYRVNKGLKEAVLERVSRPLAGPGAFLPPLTNTVAVAVEQFTMAAYDGSTWEPEWKSRSAPPKAVRITLAARGRALTTEVFIPAGNTITTSSAARADTEL